MAKRLLRQFREDWKDDGFFYAFRELLDDKIGYPLRRIYRHLLKLWDYNKVLWDAWDFDWTSLVKVQKLQLERIQKALEDGNCLNSPKHAKKVKICVALCDRILNNEYGDSLRQKQDEKYGDTEWKSEPTDNPALRRLIIDRPGAREGTPEYKLDTKETIRIMKYEEKQRERDIEYLYSLIAKHLQTWWD